jgi:hypothetical protein
LKYPIETKKQTLLVGVLRLSSNSSVTNVVKKKRLRSALLNLGGDSNSDSSNRLKILIFGMDNFQIKL